MYNLRVSSKVEIPPFNNTLHLQIQRRKKNWISLVATNETSDVTVPNMQLNQVVGIRLNIYLFFH